MEFGKNSLGGGRALFVIVIAALAFGCAGKSERSGGDDGSGLTGGTSGSGGTATGGMGASWADCLSVCERGRESCQDPDPNPPPCVQQCAEAESNAASFGCTVELGNVYACTATVSDVCDFDDCSEEYRTLATCYFGVPGAGCTESGTPSNATCTTLCERSAPCTGRTSDCARECADIASDVAAIGCADEYQGYVDCASSCTDICSFSRDYCPIVYPAYVKCVTSFCEVNPSSPACAGFF